MSEFTIIQPLINQRIHAYQAQVEDTEKIMSLLQSTAIWLRSKGTNQWSQLVEGHDVHGMADSIKRGDVFKFKSIDTNSLAAVVILLQQPSPWDKNIWGEAAESNDAIYVHRLAVNRNESGNGLGIDVMRWVESGIVFSGKERIRLDCIEDNKKLFKFYTGLGYEHKGLHSSGYHYFEKSLHL